MLQPVTLTYVLYDTEDGYLGVFMAYCALAPLVIAIALPTIFLARRELQSLYFTLGHGVNEVINLILKYSVRQPRPQGSYKYGYGMPSSHAQFLAFFLCFLALLLLNRRLNLGHSLLDVGAVLFALCSALAVSYSRVYLGVHTVEQVLVGCGVGVLFGVMWYYLMEKLIAPTIFPVIENWEISKMLYIRDNSSIHNVLSVEYESTMKYRKNGKCD